MVHKLLQFTLMGLLSALLSCNTADNDQQDQAQPIPSGSNQNVGADPNEFMADIQPENLIKMTKTGEGYYTLPVRIGSGTYNILIDTTLTSFMVFEDRVDSTDYSKGDQDVSILTLAGRVFAKSGTASIEIGDYKKNDLSMVVMASSSYQKIDGSPYSEVDGVMGFSHIRGEQDIESSVPIDIPLAAIEPTLNLFEFDFGIGSQKSDPQLSLGVAPVTRNIDLDYLFFTVIEGYLSPQDPVNLSFTDLVPLGELVYKSNDGIDQKISASILLSTAMTDTLILSTSLAESMGYDSQSGLWPVSFHSLTVILNGAHNSLQLGQAFSLDKILVRDTEYQAVVSLDRFEQFVLGFDYLDFQGGGPSGVLFFLDRNKSYLKSFNDVYLTAYNPRLISLPGLNSLADEQYPTVSDDGQIIAFQSQRSVGIEASAGSGGLDVFIYKKGTGILDLPDLKSPADDGDPSINADGSLVVFHSNREGGAGHDDIYLYDIARKDFIGIPGLNTSGVERVPFISPDGRYIAYRSEKNGVSDIFIYDRDAQINLELSNLPSGFADYDPALNTGATMLAYHSYLLGSDKPSDVLLFDVLNNRNVPLPLHLNSPAFEIMAALSPDARFLAYTSPRNNEIYGTIGRDIFLIELTTVGKPDPSLIKIIAGIDPASDYNNLTFPYIGSLSFSDTDGHGYVPISLSSKPKGTVVLNVTLGEDTNYQILSLDNCATIHRSVQLTFTDDNYKQVQNVAACMIDTYRGEMVFLAGLNSPYEESAPALTTNARFIAFHSKRPGSLGGFDVYLYERSIGNE